MKSSKKFDIDYFVTFVFLMSTCLSNIFSSSDITWFLGMIMVFAAAISKKAINKQNFRPFGLVFLGYTAFVVIRYFINVNFISDLDYSYLLSDVIFVFKYILFSWVFCVTLGQKAAVNIVKVVTHLTVISFFFFAIQLVLSSETFYNYSMALGLTPKNLIPGYTNFIIFSFTKGYHDYRNSGFLWEPGLFGCYLILTLMLHFFINKFKYDRTAIILTIGIITTFSTAVYLGFILLIFLVYRVKVPKIKPSFILIIAIFLIAFSFVPFLGAKIFDTYYEDMADVNRLKQLAPFYKSINMSYVPLNRFGSMAYLYNVFGAKLILGVSNKYDVILNRLLVVNISNGVFEFFAKVGVVGYIYLMYKYAKFCQGFVVKTEYIVYCLFILFVLAFGEPILSFPFILMFIFLYKNQTSFDKSRRRPEGLTDLNNGLPAYERN